MSLRYILGKSRTGKTTMCINEIAECSNINERIFYIVPEQFTLESEKNIIAKKGSVMNINVLGFRHFAYYLISKMGTSGRAMLDDTGRAMLIKKIVLELKDKLEFYKRSVDKQGFIDNIDMTITELMQYRVTVEKLQSAAENMKEGNLKNKLKDICLIFERYREYIAKEYISGDGALELLAENIKNSSVKNSLVWIDGFKSFTPQENRVIGELLKNCKEVSIAFTISGGSTEYANIGKFDEQYEVKRAITSITRLARDNNVQIEKPVFLSRDYIKQSDEIEFIKNNYFKYNFEPYSGEVENIAILKASNMYDEIDRVCCEIKGLVQHKGFRYKDIALIMGSSNYEKPLSAAFKKYDIPNFLDGRREAASHPLIAFITGAIDTIAYSWDNSAVFKMLKTGYTDIEFDRIYAVENYVKANGIDKYKWNREWKYGFKAEGDRSNKPEKEYIIETRDMIFDVISPLSESFNSSRRAAVRDITEKLFEILENINAAEKIENEFNNALEKGDAARAALYEQIWDTVIDVVNKMVDILGNERVTVREYSKILSTGLRNATIGIAPPTQDYIIAGDMDRTRFPDIRAMFIVGANDGSIPTKIYEKGLFNDDDKAVMEECDVELAPNTVQMTNNGRLSIYFNLIKAKERLVISYPTGSIDGESFKPSTVVSKIKSMFSELREESVVYSNEPDYVLAGREAAFDKVIMSVSENDNSEFIRELYRYYANDDEYGKKIEAIKNGVLSQVPESYINKRLLNVLWEQVLSRASVSKLEQFTSCPFKFYMQYILNARENDVYELKSSNVGTLAHRMMEDFSKYINENGIAWESTNKEYTDAFVEGHIGEYIREMDTDIFESSRNAALLGKIKEAAKYALWANVEQVKASKFKPESFEISFGRGNYAIPAIEIEVENGKILKLSGIIDRVDKMLKDDGSVYVKIVDYKSSSKTLDINKIYNGLQLQLVLYMNAVMSNKNKRAGGMFYFEVNEPELLAAEEIKEALSYEDSVLKRLALNGMYDESVADELDFAHYEVTRGRSKEIVKIMRDISEKGSEALSEDKMNELLKYSMETVKEIGAEMAKGNIKISPYRYGEEDSCKYCPYGIVCDFENGDGKELRNIRKSDEENWEKIHNKVGKKE